MNKPKKHFGIAVLQFLMFCLLFFLHFSGILTIKSLHATPAIMIPFLVTFCMFTGELSAALTGLLLGFFMDAFTSGGSNLHTFYFSILGCLVSILVHYMLNNNFKTAIMLSLVASLVYYFLRWFFFHAFRSDVVDSTGFLMQYVLPSVVYTNIFAVPFYFLQSFINKHKTN